MVTVSDACESVVEEAVEHYGNNLDLILARLNEAKEPDTPLFMLNYYNPVDTGDDTDQILRVEEAVQQINATIEEAAARHEVFLVDIHPLFVGKAGTLITAVDPTDAGHAVIAQAYIELYQSLPERFVSRFTAPPDTTPEANVREVFAFVTPVPGGLAGGPTSDRQEQLTRLAPEGWRMAAAADGSFDQRNSYVVAEWERDDHSAKRVTVYQVEGTVLSSIWELEAPEVTVDFEHTYLDLNGDAMSELVFLAGVEGNAWCGKSLRLLSFRGMESSELRIEAIPEAAPVAVLDVDGDSTWEVTSVDCSWELAPGFSHSASPSSTYVLRWDPADSGYREASASFPDYYRRQIAKQEAQAHELLTEVVDSDGCRGADAYVGRVVSIFLDHARGGIVEEGRLRLSDLLSPETLPCQAWKARFPNLIQTLEDRYMSN